MASSTTAAARRIGQLRDELNHHNHLYYIEARPQISDREYDKLLAELIELERANPELITPDSPSQRVGGDVQTELKPVKHAVPMMSIDNTYNEEEVRAFFEPYAPWADLAGSYVISGAVFTGPARAGTRWSTAPARRLAA